MAVHASRNSVATSSSVRPLAGIGAASERAFPNLGADAVARERRKRRIAAQGHVLDLICRTLIEGPRGTLVRMGDKPLRDFETPHIDAFRRAPRKIHEDADRKRKERAAKIAAGEKDAHKLPLSSQTPRARSGEVGTNRYLEVLRHLFNWTIKAEHYKEENPS